MKKDRHQFIVELKWIEPELGGHSHPPRSGMRCPIVFVSRFSKVCEQLWDGQIEAVLGSDGRGSYTLIMSVLKDAIRSQSVVFEQGEQFILFTGGSVLAVGIIKSTTSQANPRLVAKRTKGDKKQKKDR